MDIDGDIGGGFGPSAPGADSDSLFERARSLLLHTATPEAVLKFLKNSAAAGWERGEVSAIQGEYFEAANREIVPILADFLQGGSGRACSNAVADSQPDGMDGTAEALQPLAAKTRTQDSINLLQLTTFAKLLT